MNAAFVLFIPKGLYGSASRYRPEWSVTGSRKKILEATPAIERWFRLEWQEHTPPFYCSVDLRNAGFKLAPVDTNLFPAVSIIWHRKCCRWQYRLQWPRLKNTARMPAICW
jgi:hypothetical protein